MTLPTASLRRKRFLGPHGGATARLPECYLDELPLGKYANGAVRAWKASRPSLRQIQAEMVHGAEIARASVDAITAPNSTWFQFLDSSALPVITLNVIDVTRYAQVGAQILRRQRDGKDLDGHIAPSFSRLQSSRGLSGHQPSGCRHFVSTNL